MASQRNKSTANVLHTFYKRRQHRTVKRAARQRKRATVLSRSQALTKILNQAQRESIRRLKIFEASTHLNPLIAQCTAMDSKSYSWSQAKILDYALHKRIKSARNRTSKVQYTTPGPATRVWIPRWPNENPYLSYDSSEIPEDKHGKSRESIVRIVQDQEQATKEIFKFVSSCQGWSTLPAEEKKWQQREHSAVALRLEGIEVFDWDEGCPGWRMEVYFQREESWKGSWGLSV